MPEGKMQITGKLGDVMQESVKAAKSYIRSKSLDYGIIHSIFDKKDFHIHVPRGATPKDGPSAGMRMIYINYFSNYKRYQLIRTWL